MSQHGQYDGSWTCLTKTGMEKGPCSVTELCILLLEYGIPLETGSLSYFG